MASGHKGTLGRLCIGHWQKVSADNSCIGNICTNLVTVSPFRKTNYLKKDEDCEEPSFTKITDVSKWDTHEV